MKKCPLGELPPIVTDRYALKGECMKISVPYSLAKGLVDRHGGKLYVCSQKDWKKVLKVIEKHPKACEEVSALNMVLTPLLIRDQSGKVVK